MDWKTRVRSAFGDQAPDEDVLEELAQHASDAYQAARAGGQDHASAERAVEDQLRESARDPAALARRRACAPAPPPPASSPLTGIAHDTRYALRLLRRQPGHAAAAVVTMALGIGATTVIFSVLYGVLLKPLPWPAADRLVRLSETRRGGMSRFGPILTNATYRAWRADTRTLDSLAAYSGGAYTISNGVTSVRAHVAEVTAGVFPLFGARTTIGSFFTAADEELGGSRPIVISQGLWQEWYGGRRSALGRSLQVDGEPHRIVGVVSSPFGFPTPDTRAWIPLQVRPVSDGKSNAKWLSLFNGVGRLRSGVTPAQASAEGTSRARGGEDLGLVGVTVFGSAGPIDVSAVPLADAETAEVRPALLVFLAAVGLLLATAAANVANLQLARTAARRREMAIRLALGAGTSRLARQLLVESTVLALAGGALGVAIAATLHLALPTLLPADFPRLAEIRLNLPVLALSLAVSAVSGLACGIWPALQARRPRLGETLSEDGLAPVGGGMRSRTGRARVAVMVLQVACACVLLLGAVLLTRSFQSLVRADRGYDPHNVLTASLPMPDALYTGTRRAEFATTLLQRLRQAPGVRAAAVSATLPLTAGEMLGGFTMPTRNGTKTVKAAIRQVSPDYFRALGVRLVAGRTFTAADTAASQQVVVVNRSFVKQYLEEPAVGQRLPSGEIVGVVEDVRQRGVTDTSQPELYHAWTQLSSGLGAAEPKLVVRTSGDPRALVPTIRALVRELDPMLAIDDVRTMEDRVGGSIAKPRLYAVLLGGFALSALVIAAVGLFAVLAYNVAQRSREIGVRTALGARPRDIVTLVLRQGFTMALGGSALGLLVSFAVLKYLSTLLYGVTVYDAWSYAVVVSVLLLVSAIACVIPARRASRLDPLRALRT